MPVDWNKLQSKLTDYFEKGKNDKSRTYEKVAIDVENMYFEAILNSGQDMYGNRVISLNMPLALAASLRMGFKSAVDIPIPVGPGVEQIEVPDVPSIEIPSIQDMPEFPEPPVPSLFDIPSDVPDIDIPREELGLESLLEPPSEILPDIPVDMGVVSKPELKEKIVSFDIGESFMPGTMKISNDGLSLIKSYEGLKLQAYQDSSGVWTIGYGHTSGVYPGQVITQQQADRLLLDDIKSAEYAVRKYVKVPLNQSQYDAVVDLVYNIGSGNFAGYNKNGRMIPASPVLIALNAKDYISAADGFLYHVKSGGVTLPGLVRRRNEEKNMFLYNIKIIQPEIEKIIAEVMPGMPPDIPAPLEIEVLPVDGFPEIPSAPDYEAIQYKPTQFSIPDFIPSILNSSGLSGLSLQWPAATLENLIPPPGAVSVVSNIATSGGTFPTMEVGINNNILAEELVKAFRNHSQTVSGMLTAMVYSGTTLVPVQFPWTGIT